MLIEQIADDARRMDIAECVSRILALVPSIMVLAFLFHPLLIETYPVRL